MTLNGSQTPFARRYILAGVLGHGSMGTVYRATDRLTGEQVAVKQVKPMLRRAASRDRAHDVNLALAREFTVLSTLRHPHIITVIDYGFADGQPYVAMELLENAVPITEAARDLTFQQKTDLLVQLLSALLYLHRRGVLHCDLKPRNVLVTRHADANGREELRVKVLDFGLSTLRDQLPLLPQAGTPSYMAPERMNGMPPTRASDLYAFGVICYEIYAGRRPFDRPLDQLMRQVIEEPPDLSALDVPDHIRFMIGWLLAKDPNSRYTDAREVLSILQNGVDFALATETYETRESLLVAARFVGRDAEMQYLVGQLRRALVGCGSALLVGGESGVGKSRVLDELRTRALVDGAVVARGMTRREGGKPYAVWRDFVRQLCLETTPDEAEAAVLRATFSDIEPLLPMAGKPAPALPPKAEQQRLVRTIEALLRRVTRPLVVLLEDLHWDLGESRGVLHHLSRIAPELPLLLIASYRDDERPGLPASLPELPVLTLQRLSPEATAELVEAMLGAHEHLPVIVERLQAETEGNAFFLVETVRALAEEAGQLAQIGREPMPTQILPGGINGIIQRRLSRVPARARLFMQAAAVAGRELDVAVLAEVMRRAQVSESPDTLLDLCAEAAVLTVHNGNWAFSHGKLRDAVLQALPAEQTRRLHERVAMAIEEVYQYSALDTTAALAFHWRQAGNAEREQRFAMAAGEQALRHGAYESAHHYFERALALLGVAPRPPAKEATLLAHLGDVQMALGNVTAARDWYERGLTIAREIGYRWGVTTCQVCLGQVALELDNLSLAEAYFEQALAEASEARSSRLMLQAITGLATLHCRRGDSVRAVEYAALVCSNPGADGSAHYGCTQLLERLQKTLSAEEFSAAVERGQWLSLRSLIREILSADDPA